MMRTRQATATDATETTRERALEARGSRVEQALARLYRRLGWRVGLVCIAGDVAIALFTIVLITAAGARFLGWSTSQALSVAALWTPIGLALVAIGAIPSIGLIRTAIAWSGGRHTPGQAEDTWNALVRVPLIITRCAVSVSLVVPALAIYDVVRFDKPWWEAIPIAVGTALAIAGPALLAVYADGLVLRPWIEDVASYLPPTFEPPRDRSRLSTKALAPLPVVTAFSAAIVGAYANLSTDGAVRIAITVGTACVTVAIATVIFAVINRTLLSPVDSLIAATERVRKGDIDTAVPIVSSDELGRLAFSFNEMLADLRRRTDELQQRAEELRDSRERIVTAADAERRKVERDLHDGAQQHLVLLNLKLAMAQRLIDSDPAGAKAMHDELRADLGRALAELRDLAHGIYPQALETEGLPAALRDAAQRSAIPTAVELNGTTRYRPELEAAVYFCCLEALQNAGKHAGEGATASIRLADQDGLMRFEIADTGQGFDPSAVRDSAGIQNMTDRIGALGGTLTIHSAAGSGTRIEGAIPL